MFKLRVHKLLCATAGCKLHFCRAQANKQISYVGQQGTLLINGGLEDASVGYSANIYFSADPINLPSQAKLIPQNGVAELGLMVGAADSMMRFPAGTTFTPYSVLRNVSNSPIMVTPTLWWMQSGAPTSAQLPQLRLLPFETRSLDMPSLLASAGLKNFSGSVNLVFDYVAKSGLLLATGSVDQTNTYVFEVAPRAIGKSAGKSVSYWSTANGDDTMITIWNPADEAQDFIFRLDFTGGHYLLPIHLEARASRTFNISEIIQTQVPDVEGNIIPAAIQSGSAKLVMYFPVRHTKNHHQLKLQNPASSLPSGTISTQSTSIAQVARIARSVCLLLLNSNRTHGYSQIQLPLRCFIDPRVTNSLLRPSSPRSSYA